LPRFSRAARGAFVELVVVEALVQLQASPRARFP
jgi:hypothetical protein